MKDKTVEFQNVDKKLSGKQILSDVNLTVASGEVIGIVGANGSGKTTLLRLATGLMYADGGAVFIAGQQVRPGLVGRLPLGVGALIENPAFLPQLSGYKNLSLLAEIRGEIDGRVVSETMTRVGLDPNSRKAVRTYSLGMKQRLGIAQAIMENPKVLVFDEPTNGLDTEGREMFSEIIREQATKGTAVMLVSHHQVEIDQFCDCVYKISESRLMQLPTSDSSIDSHRI